MRVGLEWLSKVQFRYRRPARRKPRYPAPCQKVCVRASTSGSFQTSLVYRLGDDTLTDSETPHVDLIAKALGNLVDEVVFKLLGLHIDIRLRPDQRTHVPLDVC